MASSFVACFNRATDSWYTNLPSNARDQVVFSFIGSCVWATLITANPSAGVLAGTFSAVATAIHALVTPFFKNLFQTKGEFTFGQEMLRGATALVGVKTVVGFFGHAISAQELVLGAILHGFWLSIGLASRDSRQANYLAIPSASWLRFLPDIA